MKAKWCAKKNKVQKLKKGDETWCDTSAEMKNMTRSFFVDLFTADPGVCPNQVLNFVEPKVTQEVNEALRSDVSEKEIADALFQMGPLKAQGRMVFLALGYIEEGCGDHSAKLLQGGGNATGGK
jgi:hypothetical protein